MASADVAYLQLNRRQFLSATGGLALALPSRPSASGCAGGGGPTRRRRLRPHSSGHRRRHGPAPARTARGLPLRLVQLARRPARRWPRHAGSARRHGRVCGAGRPHPPDPQSRDRRRHSAPSAPRRPTTPVPAAARRPWSSTRLSGAFVKAWASLCGTTRNCAGGPTPWGSWLTCEETLVEPRPANRFRQTHGYVFEVPSEGAATAVPLKGLGRFVHEAIAIDPSTGIVYLTEDHGAAGFYRFVPKTPGALVEGGRLEMLAVDARPRYDTRDGTAVGNEPAGALGADCRSRSAASRQRPRRRRRGVEPGAGPGRRDLRAARRARGTAADRSSSTPPAAAMPAADRSGSTSPRREQLRLVFESPGPHVLNKPDNLTVSPRGGLAICEDGSVGPQRIQGHDPGRAPVPFRPQQRGAQWRTPRLPAAIFATSEFTGVTFSPDGQWMFFNIQTPGMTFAVTGPWERGKL